MKILYIVPYIPNPIRVRPYNLIRFLAERGHAVTLATVASEQQELDEFDSMQSYINNSRLAVMPRWRSLWNSLKALPGSIPLQAVYSWKPEFATQLVHLFKHADGKIPFDIIHVEHLRGVLYGLHLKRALEKMDIHVPVVWDSVDCISHLFRQASHQSATRRSRWLTRFELARTESYEHWLSRQFDRVIVTSKTDKQAFLSLIGSPDHDQPISVLQNGVDLDYFVPNPDVVRETNTLVISGKMSYHANVSMVLNFAHELLPLIREKIPTIKLIVVGKDPPRAIRALARESGIRVTGTVEDVRPYLLGASLSVSPITYGAGIQNKVLEAMACGTSVVATPIAVSALDVEPGQDLLVAQEAGSFATAVLFLLEDAELRMRVGNAGRRYVEKNHAWEQIVTELEEIYYDVIDAKRRAHSEETS